MKKNLLLKLAILGLVLVLILPCFAGCDKAEDPQNADTTVSENETPSGGNNGGNSVTPSDSKDMKDMKAEINALKVEDFEETSAMTNYVKITVKGYGEIVIRIRADIVKSNGEGIKFLVMNRWYNGLTFHRVVKDSYIHGGCPKGNGTGGSGITLRGEFADNGVENPIQHVRGVVSAYRPDDDMNGASCQFLILTKDCPEFDGNRTAFGYVVAGMDVVDAIANAEVKDNGKGEISSPVEKIVMEKVVFVKLK